MNSALLHYVILYINLSLKCWLIDWKEFCLRSSQNHKVLSNVIRTFQITFLWLLRLSIIWRWRKQERWDTWLSNWIWVRHVIDLNEFFLQQIMEKKWAFLVRGLARFRYAFDQLLTLLWYMGNLRAILFQLEVFAEGILSPHISFD